ncbi:MAG TPA: GTPase ObgE [Candidatus Paceibacterota bacterium]
MAFIDEMQVHAVAGKGGNGVVRWLHLKGKERGGPSGGDGGRGGDIIVEGVHDLAILAAYRYTKRIAAENGGDGEGNDRHGKDGEPYVLKLPVGSSVTVSSTGETYEILEAGQCFTVLKGGSGGFGNAHFKGSTNQNPKQVTYGRNGQSGDIRVSLKLIADAGLIGFPNAGKSSLLNELTRSRSRVGAYPFTTLDPHLGDFYGRILADIPGLIEGASEGRGLGSRFLKHIERTRFLVHLVSAEQEDVVSSYRAIRKELEAFGHELSEKEELVVLSKTDVLSPSEVLERVSALEAVAGKGVLTLTILDDTSVKAFADELTKRLSAPVS